MAYLTQFGTATTANTNLNTTTLIGTFTNTTRIRKLYLNIFADQVKGGGDYKASITIQRAGAGSFYQSIITTNTAAAGVTSILFNSIAVTLNATDVMKVYLLGLSTDNDTTADIIVDVNEEWINVDTSGNITVGDYASGKIPLQPTTAGRTLDVTATGEAGLDFNNINDAAGAHTLTNITVPIVTTLTNPPADSTTLTAINTKVTPAGMVLP